MCWRLMLDQPSNSTEPPEHPSISESMTPC
ncbi:UNVERIFIED_CONTAM: hypothetical protein GTU68_013353 [Idotea baltica]|nr:hypothetical protein [Idotea baltica]